MSCPYIYQYQSPEGECVVDMEKFRALQAAGIIAADVEPIGAIGGVSPTTSYIAVEGEALAGISERFHPPAGFGFPTASIRKEYLIIAAIIAIIIVIMVIK